MRHMTRLYLTISLVLLAFIGSVHVAAQSNNAYGSPAPETSTPAPVYPPSLMTVFAADIHFVAGYDLTSSYIAYHFCSGTPKVTQCTVFDGIGSDARLIAVELIVSGDVFKTFSFSERQLWHSHAFAITSGIFVIPGLSGEQELTTLQSLIGTYGKVTNFYPPNEDVPLEAPQLAYGWTNDAQVNANLVRQMEKTLGLDTTLEQRREARKGLKVPDQVEGHDEYHNTGIINQYDITRIRVNPETGEPTR